MCAKDNVVAVSQDVFERLAALEHQQWAHWTEYMLDNLDEVHIAGWRRQIATPYEELTEREKDSDREWVQKALDLLNLALIQGENRNAHK